MAVYDFVAPLGDNWLSALDFALLPILRHEVGSGCWSEVVLRIAVCVKNDIFGAIVLNTVMPRLAEHDTAIFMSVRERTDLDDSIAELDHMRLVERQIPLDILFPLLDEAAPRPGCLQTPQQLARQTGRPITLIHDMQPTSGVAAIEAFGAETILSVRFSYLFRRSTIAQAQGGIINVHPGPLPSHRGLYAPFWQLLSGSDVVRCSIHLVDPGVDTGPVLSIEEVPVNRARSMFWHATQLYLAGANQAVRYILEGMPPATPQDPALAGKNGFPSSEDFARFRAAGFSLVKGGDYRELLLPFLHSQTAA